MDYDREPLQSRIKKEREEKGKENEKRNQKHFCTIKDIGRGEATDSVGDGVQILPRSS